MIMTTTTKAMNITTIMIMNMIIAMGVQEQIHG